MVWKGRNISIGKSSRPCSRTQSSSFFAESLPFEFAGDHPPGFRRGHDLPSPGSHPCLCTGFDYVCRARSRNDLPGQ
jgi:hypothetical protein